MQSLGTPMSYHRLNRIPLDDMEVFTSLRDLMDYCETGARYDGQRVVVLGNSAFETMEELSVNGEVATVNNNEPLVVSSLNPGVLAKYAEYVIVNNIPMIDMRGSEPIFKSGLTFQGDSTQSHGLLIYEYNGDKTWDQSDICRLDEGALCLLNQLEIFRIPSVTGAKIFKFLMTRTTRNGSTSMYTWNQTYNPYIDGYNHSVFRVNGSSISEMSFNIDSNCWLLVNDSNINLMPRTAAAINKEKDIITRIYVKAEDYYNAWK